MPGTRGRGMPGTREVRCATAAASGTPPRDGRCLGHFQSLQPLVRHSFLLPDSLALAAAATRPGCGGVSSSALSLQNLAR